MKKVMTILLIMILAVCFVFMMSAVAFAADGEGQAPVSSQEFFTWGMLATYAGCLAATLLLTQLLKGIWRSSWPTQILSYILALLILIGANLALGTLTINSGMLCVFNAAVVSLAANGTFNNVKEIKDSATKT